MFDWLFEGRSIVYLLLGLVAIVLVLVWYQSRNRKVLIGLAATLLLIGLYALLDVLVVTDREQIEREIQAMGKEVVAGNVEGLFSHLSKAPDARFIGVDRNAFRHTAELGLKHYKVHDFAVWDYDLVDMKNGTAHVTFRAKPQIDVSVPPYFRCEAVFVREDNQWKMKTLRVFSTETTNEMGPQDISH